jgi:UvrD-like helicase family protein
MVTPADGAIFQFEHRVDRELGRIMLVPAYAATIHKSQGSEYPAVIIPVLTQHYAMLQRNLLYTGVTRGKKLVVLVGRRRSPSRSATCGPGSSGRSLASGCDQNRLSHDNSAWRVEAIAGQEMHPHA